MLNCTVLVIVTPTYFTYSFYKYCIIHILAANYIAKMFACAGLKFSRMCVCIVYKELHRGNIETHTKGYNFIKNLIMHFLFV